jgi:hypothetical protein
MVGGYLFATHVDAYDVATRMIAVDPVIRDQVPGLKSHRLAFFDGYHYSTFGTDAEAKYRFVLTGEDRSATLDVVLARKAGKWTLQEGTLRLSSGQAFPLEPRQLM